MAIDDFLEKSEGRQGEDVKVLNGFLSRQGKKITTGLLTGVLALIGGLYGTFYAGIVRPQMITNQIMQEREATKSKLSLLYSQFLKFQADNKEYAQRYKDLKSFGEKFSDRESLMEAKRFASAFEYADEFSREIDDVFFGLHLNLNRDVGIKSNILSHSATMPLARIKSMARKNFAEDVRGQKNASDILVYTDKEMTLSWLEAYEAMDNFSRRFCYNDYDGHGNHTGKNVWQWKNQAQKPIKELEMLIQALRDRSFVFGWPEKTRHSLKDDVKEIYNSIRYYSERRKLRKASWNDPLTGFDGPDGPFLHKKSRYGRSIDYIGGME